MIMNRKLLSALRALANQITAGPNEARLEAVIDRETNAVLIALAEELGGGQRRSAAARLLLKRGAQAMLDDVQVSA
jgi:hypothetical protein